MNIFIAKHLTHILCCVLKVSPHQLGVAFVVQYDVLRLEVSVDNSSGMQESQSLYDTASVEPGSAVIK